MLLQVYRLGLVDQSIARMARHARDLERSGVPPGESMWACVAYESPELAALCSPDLLRNVRRRTELLRETLALPLDPALHATPPASRFGIYDPESTPHLPLIEHMVQHGLLTLWLPCINAPSQHAVFVNPAHEAFERIVVTKRQMVLTRPAWSGSVQVPDAMPPESPCATITEPGVDFFAQVAAASASRLHRKSSLHKTTV